MLEACTKFRNRWHPCITKLTKILTLTLLDLMVEFEHVFSQFYTLAPRLVDGSGAARAAPGNFPGDL